MATKIKKTKKLQEAEPMMDQNMAPAPATPATPDDMAAAPAQPVDEQAAPIEEPATEETAPAEGELPIEVDPATVSLEVKVPTDQLAAAVSQSTGDVVPAETAPDAMATQEADLVSSTADNLAEQPATTEEAPVEEQQPAPVMESQETETEEKITESHGECEASEAATKHDEDKLEKIIDTGVKNEGEGAMENGNTSDGENKLDLMKTGVDNMKESLDEEDEESDEEEDDEDIKIEPVDEIKNAGVVDAVEDVPGLEEGDGIDDIDDMFDEPVEPDSDEFMDKIEDFLGNQDVEDVADALRTTASFLDQIAREEGDKPLDFGELLDNKYDDAEDAEDTDELESAVDAIDDTEPEVEEDEDFDIDDGLSDEDFEEDEESDEDKMFESVQRRLAYTTSRRQTPAPVVDKVKPLNESSIIYPVGSEPVDSARGIPADTDMVRRQERLSQSRREAIRNYRRSVLEESDRNQSKSRFNEALRSSAKSIRNSEENSEGSWESNNFMSRYGESRLNYKELLNNHFLG